MVAVWVVGGLVFAGAVDGEVAGDVVVDEHGGVVVVVEEDDPSRSA